MMYLYYVITNVELFCFQVVLSELHVYFKRPSFTTNLHLTHNFDNTSYKLIQQLSSPSTLLAP